MPICEKLKKRWNAKRHLCANVDLYAAPVFWMLGFPPELNTPSSLRRGSPAGART